MILSVQHGNEVKGMSYRLLVRCAGFQEWEQIFGEFVRSRADLRNEGIKPEYQALKNLKANKDIVIHKSDKGNSVVRRHQVD